ncbi:MAG: cation:proton antiporter [Candidatus Diapherotrites archaeon]|uniref:Cation:proton antiporter n=1 Tax=Candidatus Iainarchaeum sp. TaxID=3101447 RepID=A0A8T4L2Z1_9ARCH|nr:cation:proton antiporter [Candidatus Diapherotrites archaeon]
MVQELTLLYDLGLVLVAGTLFGFIARELKQPLLAGYILAGLAIGPLALKLISDYSVISVLSELGIAFLLFAIGMEIDFSKLTRFKKPIILGGVAQVLITAGIVGIGLPLLGLTFLESVYLGLIVAFSSSVIAIKILTDSKQLNSLEGKMIIGYALVQDLLAVILLPLLANPSTIFSPAVFFQLLSGFALLVATGFVLAKWVFPRVTTEAAKSQEIFFLTTISSCFVFIFLSNHLSFPLAVGAFIGGLALGRIPFNLEAQNSVHYIRDLFGTVFFVALGLQMKALVFTPLFFVLLLVVFLLNPLIFIGISLFQGFGLQTGLTIGLTLFQASEFSFIIASQGLELGQLSQATFDAAVWVILLSMIATPYMIRLNRRLHDALVKHFKGLKPHMGFFERNVKEYQQVPHDELLFDHVIVAGAGVFGEQIVDAVAQTQKVLVIEQDPDIVQKMIRRKIPSIYSSRNNVTVLDKVGFEKAAILVVTIPDHRTALNMVMFARKRNSGLTIFARAHKLSEAIELYDAGADRVILPQVMASNYCLQEIRRVLAGEKPSFGLEQRFLGLSKQN